MNMPLLIETMEVLQTYAPTPITDDNVFAHVFFSVFDGLKAHSVYTNGKLRVENYKIVSDYKYDLDVVDRLWSKFGGAQWV